MPKEEQIDTKTAPNKAADDKGKKDETPKDDKGMPLSEQDIKLFKQRTLYNSIIFQF